MTRNRTIKAENNAIASGVLQEENRTTVAALPASNIKPDPINEELINQRLASGINESTIQELSSAKRVTTSNFGADAAIISANSDQLLILRSVAAGNSPPPVEVTTPVSGLAFAAQEARRRGISQAELLEQEKTTLEEALTLRADIEPNILTQYENPTYNVRFFMTKEDIDYDTLANAEIFVIAETGSTGFNINDLTINSIVAPSPTTKNTTATKISFTITEPHGNKLFDQIRNGGAALGIFHHIKVPMWLEISFKGYSQSDADSFTGGGLGLIENTTENINDITFFWRMNITDTEIEMNQGGAVYKFRATPWNESGGFKDESRRIETNVVIEAKTLGDFFEKFALSLNNNENYSLENVPDDNLRVRKYAFGLSNQFPDMSSWIIRNSEDNKSEQLRTSKTNNSDRTTVRFFSGTPVEVIISEIIGTTEEGKNLAIVGEKNRSSTTAGEKDHTRKSDTPAKIFMVEPITEILGYNPVSNLYNILITYHIRPYVTFKPMISREEIKQFSEESKKRLNAMINISRVKKEYNYMFTGLNTEVLDYKIEFSLAWQISLPMFRGQARDAVAQSGRRNGPEVAAAQVRQVTANTNAPDDVNSSTSTKVTAKLLDELKVAIDEAGEESVAISELSALGAGVGSETPAADRLRRLRSQVEKLSAERLERANQDISPDRIDTSFFGASTNVIRVESDLASRETSGDFNSQNIGNEIQIFGSGAERTLIAERRLERQSQSGSIFFVEDLEKKSVAALQPKTQDKKKEARPPPSNEVSGMSGGTERNVEGTLGKGRSYFSAILNQMYGNQGEMISLDLTIRGDPYWIGEPNPRKRLSGTTDNPGLDLTGSDIYFLMTFNFPERYDDGGFLEQADSFKGTGLLNLQDGENGFNGIYRVLSVENEFSNGKFIQKLSCQIDEVTKEQDFIQLIAGIKNR